MHVQWEKWSHHNGIKFTSWAFHSRGTIWLFNFYYGTLDFITGNFSSFFLHFDGIEWQGKFWPYFDIRSPRFWTIRLIFFFLDSTTTCMETTVLLQLILMMRSWSPMMQLLVTKSWYLLNDKRSSFGNTFSDWPFIRSEEKGYFRNLFLTYLISLPVCKRKSISYISDWTCSTIL